MELPRKKCGICGEHGSNLRFNLMTLKTKYSGTCVYQLLERFVECELSELALTMIGAAACNECYAKFNDYDAAYTKALIVQKELLDLLRNGTLGIGSVYEKLEYCDVDEEDDDDNGEPEPQDEQAQYSDEQEHSQEGLDSTTTSTSTRQEIGISPVRVSFPTGVSWKCNACGKRFKDIDEMQNHKHIKEEPDGIAFASEATESLLSVESIPTDEAEGKYIEERCGELSVEAVDPTDTPTDAEDVEYVIEELDQEENESNGETAKKVKRTSECYYCDESFSSKADFKAHLESEHAYDNGNHKCKVCGFLAKTRAALSSHVSKHSRPPLKCTVCSKEFGQKGSLQRHMAVHTGEKAFHCELCGKSYVHYSSFYMHQLAHKNIRGKKCKICGYELRSSSHLSRHMRTHSGEKPFKCPECQQGFSQRYNMISHLNAHKGIFRRSGRIFVCQLCKGTFERASKLTKHLKDVHEISNDSEIQKASVIKNEKITTA